MEKQEGKQIDKGIQLKEETVNFKIKTDNQKTAILVIQHESFSKYKAMGAGKFQSEKEIIF